MIALCFLNWAIKYWRGHTIVKLAKVVLNYVKQFTSINGLDALKQNIESTVLSTWSILKFF